MDAKDPNPYVNSENAVQEPRTAPRRWYTFTAGLSLGLLPCVLLYGLLLQRTLLQKIEYWLLLGPVMEVALYTALSIAYLIVWADHFAAAYPPTAREGTPNRWVRILSFSSGMFFVNLSIALAPCACILLQIGSMGRLF